MKTFLAKQPKVDSIAALQDQVARFVDYYNEVLPHGACGRKPPLVAFEARDKARPSGPQIQVGAGVRVRKDRIDKNGKVTLRHRTRLLEQGILLWTLIHHAILRFRERRPDWTFLRLEDIAHDPAGEFEKICARLGLTLSDEALALIPSHSNAPNPRPLARTTCDATALPALSLGRRD